MELRSVSRHYGPCSSLDERAGGLGLVSLMGAGVVPGWVPVFCLGLK